MKMSKRLRQNTNVILFILIASLLVQPVQGQDSSVSQVGETQTFLPFVSSQFDVINAANHQDDQGNDNAHNRIHHHANEDRNRSRFAALSGEWPPQSKSMRNIEWNDTSAVLNKIAQRRAKNTVALRNAAVQEALGERFVYIGTEELARKGNRGRTDVRNTYFSHTNNQTIEVTVEQNQVTDIRLMDAAEYQPPLAPEEVGEAISIARNYFDGQGVSRVAELEGFTILTFPGEGEGNFYANRVGYVSFHPDADTPPEYVAWVDLTNQVVVESREE